jgi:hypothetical protein
MAAAMYRVATARGGSGHEGSILLRILLLSSFLLLLVTLGSSKVVPGVVVLNEGSGGIFPDAARLSCVVVVAIARDAAVGSTERIFLDC